MYWQINYMSYSMHSKSNVYSSEAHLLAFENVCFFKTYFRRVKTNIRQVWVNIHTRERISYMNTHANQITIMVQEVLTFYVCTNNCMDLYRDIPTSLKSWLENTTMGSKMYSSCCLHIMCVISCCNVGKGYDVCPQQVIL